jgi:hypothetical protein
LDEFDCFCSVFTMENKKESHIHFTVWIKDSPLQNLQSPSSKGESPQSPFNFPSSTSCVSSSEDSDRENATKSARDSFITERFEMYRSDGYITVNVLDGVCPCQTGRPLCPDGTSVLQTDKNIYALDLQDSFVQRAGIRARVARATLEAKLRKESSKSNGSPFLSNYDHHVRVNMSRYVTLFMGN